MTKCTIKLVKCIFNISRVQALEPLNEQRKVFLTLKCLNVFRSCFSNLRCIYVFLCTSVWSILLQLFYHLKHHCWKKSNVNDLPKEKICLLSLAFSKVRQGTLFSAFRGAGCMSRGVCFRVSRRYLFPATPPIVLVDPFETLWCFYDGLKTRVCFFQNPEIMFLSLVSHFNSDVLEP